MQLKRKAKLPTVIGLTTKHAVCCKTLINFIYVCKIYQLISENNRKHFVKIEIKGLRVKRLLSMTLEHRSVAFLKILYVLAVRCCFCGLFVLFIPCVCHAFAYVYVALLPPAGKGLASWMSFVMFSFLTHLVSWVRCGT